MTRVNGNFLGLEALALLYSLPYALLMWGYVYLLSDALLSLTVLFFVSVVAFLVAFFCLFFQNSTSESRALVGSLSVVVAALVVWCIVTYWETQPKEEPSKRPLIQLESQVDDSDADEEKSVQRGSQRRIKDIINIIRHIPDLVYSRGSID